MARTFNFFIRRPHWRLWVNFDLGWRQRVDPHTDARVAAWTTRLIWQDWRKGVVLGPLYAAVVWY